MEVIRTRLKSLIQAALEELGLEESSDLAASISITRPAVLDYGDWASNAAMVSAKRLKKPPMELAKSLAEILNRYQKTYIKQVKVEKPGFLNFFLSNEWLYDSVRHTLDLGVENFARSNLGGGKKILVEFVSANPTGPLHAGHAKGAVLGDSLARLYERCGFNVSREYYVNDLGNQVDLYARSLDAQLKSEELPTDGYQGAYIKEWAGEWTKEGNAEFQKEGEDLAEDLGEDLASLKKWGLKRARDDQEKDLKQLGIEFDGWFLESSLQGGSQGNDKSNDKTSDKISQTLKALEDKKLTYLEDGALWLETSKYGDDKDRVLVKSDQSYTYLLPDIAYHLDKLERAEEVVNVWGADHHGYTGRLKAALTALGMDSDRLKVIICQLVRLESEGEEVRLSKRTGEIILLRDLIDRLGPSAVRFTFLLQSADSTQTVDLEKAAEQSMDNPVYYVQYAHTRIRSIQRKIEVEKDLQKSIAEISTPNLNLLVHPRELELMRILSDMEHLVEDACRESAPHKLTAYLRDLAGAFHSFYHDCRVFSDEEISIELTRARLELIAAVGTGLKVGLDLCGVEAPEKM